MVTASCPPVNVTRALVAGPRMTPVDPKPCWGLHDTRYARAPAQLATSVPPGEVSTVPPVAPGEGGGAEWRATGTGAPRRAGLFRQRAVDRCDALLVSPARGHALPEHAHREQAAAGRGTRPDQPGCHTEEHATVHKPRLTREVLSACKGGLKPFIYEKFI